MSELFRALPALVVFIVLGLIATILQAFLHIPPEGLIAPLAFGWKLRSGMLYFIGYLPALFTSGILTGYAIAFAPRKGNEKQDAGRWSAAHIDHLRGAFVLCIAMLAVYVSLSEGVRPVLLRMQSTAIAKSEDYHEYLRLAQQDIDAHDYSAAEPRVSSALLIWKNDDTSRLIEVVQAGLAEKGDAKAVSGPIATAEIQADVLNPEKLTVASALDKSREASSSGDYYSAHYYALLAWRLAPGTDPLKQDALRMSSEAWNRIEQGDADSASSGDRLLFATKRSGYEAIQNGDFLSAYYILQELSATAQVPGGPIGDPDVDRLLGIARQGLLESRFFIDETATLEAFESDRNVFFAIRRTDGGRDAVFARGITYARENGHDLAYLRGLEYAAFDDAGSLKYQFSDSYAKMFAWRDEDGILRPELLLRSVDRSRPGPGVEPAVIAGELAERDRGVLVLDMPYGDFFLATLANRGPASMDLADLTNFADRAERYGFSRVTFYGEIISRLADPFIVLIVAMLMLTMGWKYRLGDNVYFRAWWILPLPTLPFVTYAIVEAARYFVRLFVTVFVGIMPDLALLVTLGSLVLAFVASTVYFFSQRAD